MDEQSFEVYVNRMIDLYRDDPSIWDDEDEDEIPDDGTEE